MSRTNGLRVEGVNVEYELSNERVEVLHNVSFTVNPGETLALVGESGSGKSTTVAAIAGLLAQNGRVSAGQITLGDLELTTLSEPDFRQLRGRTIGWIPQDPGTSLDPLTRVGDSVAAPLEIHGWGTPETRRQRVIELLTKVGVPEPERRAAQYPHELSGGLKQRVLIAGAIALSPDLLIADEATSALDVTVQRVILNVIDDLRRQDGLTVIMVTHDLAVAADRSDVIAVLHEGSIVESGATERVLSAPQHAYTRQLIADAPGFNVARARESDQRAAPKYSVADRRPAVDRRGEAPTLRHPAAPVLDVAGLSVRFASRSGTVTHAVRDLDLRIERAQTHAIVGESGSGKSTTARAILGLVTPESGDIAIAGIRRASASHRELRELRRRVQLVYQNPMTSLDPRFTVENIIEEPLRALRIGTRRERSDRVDAVLADVALSDRLRSRRPRELSGGQRQRVAIARALVARPDLVVLDEAVSALDVSVQAQILEILTNLQAEHEMSFLFISHDLAVVRQIADTVSVMRNGQIVESGSCADVFLRPSHEYTADLLAAIPGTTASRALDQHGGVSTFDVPDDERHPASESFDHERSRRRSELAEESRDNANWDTARSTN